MAWEEEDAHHVMGSDYQFERTVSNMKGSVGRGMWMDISGWAPIWENHWISITEWSRTPTVHETQVCEQQIAWPMPSPFFTQQPHGQSGHSFRHRDETLAQQGPLTKADCLLSLLMN